MFEGGSAKARRWTGALLFLGVLGLYLATLCRGPFPGESAAVAVQFGGLSDFPPYSHPLYAAAAGLVAHLPGGTLAGRLHVFSALCGALAVTLLFRALLLVPLPYFADPAEARRAPRFRSAHVLHLPLLSALFGALTLALSAPFWFVATRAHFAAFDLMLLAALAVLLLHYFHEGGALEAVGFAFGFGMLTTEYAPALLLAPAVGGLFAWAMVRHGHLLLHAIHWETGWAEWRLPLGCAAAFVAGMFPYLVEAAVLAHVPSAAWRGQEGFGPALLEIARQQVRTLALCRMMPGALLAVAMNVVPLLLIGATAWLAAGGSRRAALAPAALAAGLALAVAYNAPFTPWRVCGFLPLMVTPAALAAAWAGYLFGALPRLVLAQAGDADLGARRARGLALGLLALGAAALAGSGALAFREVDGRAARLFDDYARRVAADCGDCAWLVSASPFGDLVVLAADGRRPPLRVANLALSAEPAYLRSIAARLDDPRFGRLADAGPDAFFRAWLTREAAGPGTMAILDFADAWGIAGGTGVPAGTVTRGRQLAVGERTAWHVAQSALWAEWAPRRAELERIGHPRVRDWAGAIFRSLARNANDSGVLLESVGRPGEAGDAYAAARRLDPESVSARFNEAVLARRAGWPDAAERARAFQDFARTRPGALRLDAVRRTSGHLADPAAIRALGLSWTAAR